MLSRRMCCWRTCKFDEYANGYMRVLYSISLFSKCGVHEVHRMSKMMSKMVSKMKMLDFIPFVPFRSCHTEWPPQRFWASQWCRVRWAAGAAWCGMVYTARRPVSHILRDGLTLTMPSPCPHHALTMLFIGNSTTINWKSSQKSLFVLWQT